MSTTPRDCLTHMSCITMGTAPVDPTVGRVYDPSYPVATRAPQGCASYLCSRASRSTLAKVAAALGPRPTAVLDQSRVQEQRRAHDYGRSGRARSLRGTCDTGGDRRSRPAKRDEVNRLRDRGTSQWRKSDVAHPVVLPERDTLGLRAVGSSQLLGRQRKGCDSASSVRRVDPHGRRRPDDPRSFARRSVYRLPSGARLFFPSQRCRSRASNHARRVFAGCERLLRVWKGSDDGYRY